MSTVNASGTWAAQRANTTTRRRLLRHLRRGQLQRRLGRRTAPAVAAHAILCREPVRVHEGHGPCTHRNISHGHRYRSIRLYRRHATRHTTCAHAKRGHQTQQNTIHDNSDLRRLCAVKTSKRLVSYRFCRSRTCNLWIRSPMLYPVELRTGVIR